MRRRSLLIGTAALGLVVGWSVLPPRSRLGRPEDAPGGADGPEADAMALNGWILVGRDNLVRLAMPKSEMGQGVHTAGAMMAAEELGVQLAQVVLVPPGDATLFGNAAVLATALPETAPDGSWADRGLRAARWMATKVGRELGLRVTGGSSSTADLWDIVPLAAATARAQLLGAASLRWRLPVDELRWADGEVSHPSGEHATYAELADAAAITPPGDVVRRPRAQWSLLGRAPVRVDLPAKIDGSAVYGIDARPPGLLHAVVLHAPQVGGAPARADVDAARRMAGVERVVNLPPLAGADAALAVVARTSWHAMQAARAMPVRWARRPGGALSTERWRLHLRELARRTDAEGGGTTLQSSGDFDRARQLSTRRLSALYEAPLLPHLTMEPPNCTARVADGRVELWAPTQVPAFARAAAARVADVPEDAVTVHVTLLGGGFGRQLEVDVVAQAVRVALECGGRPVQLLWPREQDVARDHYRPMAAAVLHAGLDAAGGMQYLTVTGAGDAITPGWLQRVMPSLPSMRALPDPQASDGLWPLPYAAGHRRVAHVDTDSGIRAGMWRSVGHSHHAAFVEGFIDEIAHDAGQDPIAFRLGLLDGRPRLAAALQRVAQVSRWSSPPPASTGRGVALHASFGSVVAMVAEVTLEDGRPRVQRIVAVVDCGTVVHPDIVRQQVEGSVIFGLSAALHGRIDIENGQVVQQNFPDLPLLTLRDTPRIEVRLIDSEAPPSGIGESAVATVAPAVANALFDLTGQRLRSMPLTLEDTPQHDAEPAAGRG